MRRYFEQINDLLIQQKQKLAERERVLDLLFSAEKDLKVAKRALKQAQSAYQLQARQIDKLKRQISGDAEIIYATQEQMAQLPTLEMALIDQQLRIDLEQVDVDYFQERLVELEERLVDLATVDSVEAQLVQQQIDMIQATGHAEVKDFIKLCEQISLLQDQVNELDEALMVGEKCVRDTSKLLAQVRHVWRAPNDYRLGWEIDKARDIANHLHPKLQWFYRELQDTSLPFERTPRMSLTTEHRYDTVEGEGKRAPRFQVVVIEELMIELVHKVKELKQALELSRDKLDEYREERVRALELYWRPEYFDDSVWSEIEIGVVDSAETDTIE